MIKLENITKVFANGDEKMIALKNINLHIQKGEFIAIVGQSGSGKSTLMNIIGCLDTLSSGSYKLEDKDITHFSADELSALRLKKFGFIFQRYNLINANSAKDNVALPGIYAGMPKDERDKRALNLLEILELKEKAEQNPNTLSGGQQQRVSIARALMNGGEILLCDEPTGALDSASGVMVMNIIKKLHEQGHTIIMVTHDKGLAKWANRTIELKDGEIIKDRSRDKAQVLAILTKNDTQKHSSLHMAKDRFFESLAMSIESINAHKLRSFLTMLGIIIGITSVICVVALAKGSQERIISSINKMGTNTIRIMPGRGWSDREAFKLRQFSVDDTKVLERLDFIDFASPIINSAAELIFGSITSSASIRAGNEKNLKIAGVQIESGRDFTIHDIHSSASLIIIDANTAQTFFKGIDPLGKTILLDKHPFTIIGVAKKDEGAFSDSSLNVYMPYTTLMNKLTGNYDIRSIIVSVKNTINGQLAEEAIRDIMRVRRGADDFHMMNSDTIMQTIKATTDSMSLLISGIAFISLLVGGIGVMNIMLVSVTERTREIGVRMAIGANSTDIMLQFLIEAILLCAVGGAVGIFSSFLIGKVFNFFTNDMQMIFSGVSVFIAFGISSLIGIIFGYMPAKNASNLNPIEALQRD